jgi:type VI secretion system secreted protein VgrG
MPIYEQAERLLTISTPLKKDALLPVHLHGYEAISSLFSFRVDLLAAEYGMVHFERIVGRSVTVEMRLPGGNTRYFNGIVRSFSQGGSDAAFVHYSAVIVPNLWLLTKKVCCRVFQHLSVPEILRQVFAGLDVSYRLVVKYPPRDYCVQYRESDFDFASRLMEEEGIYYWFSHADGSHTMIVADTAHSKTWVPGQSTIDYDPSQNVGTDIAVTVWEKTQELRAGKYMLRDHCFELPDDHLEVKQRTLDGLTVGAVTHHRLVGGNDQLEIYDYPGGYAQRFDGISQNGNPQPEELRQVYHDGERTVRIRMEQEEAAGLRIEGASNSGQFTAGHRFALERHVDANGTYLLTRVEHEAQSGGYRTGEDEDFYRNRFTCIPEALQFRPQRVTARPVIGGVQTATVVGPPNEEIFVDKYGRVKVHFHWDREGQNSSNASCWVRVAQVWAGKNWGAFFWPRIGHEVVVAFEEGDPDQPLIVGSVYNAVNMPPYLLPTFKQIAGMRSASVRGNANRNFNGIVFNDAKGSEHLAIHSERNLSLNSEYDKMIHAGRHKGERVSNSSMLAVGTMPGGGSGGGDPPMEQGNSVAIPRPINEAPGLNAIWVFGENMQAALGINHQVAVGFNQQICINPVGLLGGISSVGASEPLLTGLLGGSVGGNIQLTYGSNVQLTVGQAVQINLGPKGINVDGDGSYKSHLLSFVLTGVIGLAAIAYSIAYGCLVGSNDYVTCGTVTLVYQELVDVLLETVMITEMLINKVYDTVKKTWTSDALYDAAKAGLKAMDSDAPGVSLPWSAAVIALLALITATLVSTLDHQRMDDETSASHQPAPG